MSFPWHHAYLTGLWRLKVITTSRSRDLLLIQCQPLLQSQILFWLLRRDPPHSSTWRWITFYLRDPLSSSTIGIGTGSRHMYFICVLIHCIESSVTSCNHKLFCLTVYSKPLPDLCHWPSDFGSNLRYILCDLFCYVIIWCSHVEAKLTRRSKEVTEQLCHVYRVQFR